MLYAGRSGGVAQARLVLDYCVGLDAVGCRSGMVAFVGDLRT